MGQFCYMNKLIFEVCFAYIVKLVHNDWKCNLKALKKAFSFNLHFNILPSVVFFIHLCCYRTVDSICSSSQTSASLRWKGVLVVRPGTQWLKPFSAPAAVTSADWWSTRPPSTLTVKGTSADIMVYKFSVSNPELTLFFLSHCSSSSSGLGLSVDIPVRGSPVLFFESSDRDPELCSCLPHPAHCALTENSCT